jgi:hypothetical protein
MLPNNNKTSLLIPSQLPAFIQENTDEYSNFILFLQAYYEWLELQDNITDVSKNLLTYKDVDGLLAANTAVAGSSGVIDEFINYFENDFLSYFPKNILANQAEAIKLAKQLYQSKGTPASYQFLFRVLYNTSVDFFITGDAVLKASSGSWYVPVSLKLSSSDVNFLATKNLRIFGINSKAIATIENAVLVKGKIEVFISNVERLFQSGEFVNIVDSNNQFVYFLNDVIIPTYNNMLTYYFGDLVVYNNVTYEVLSASVTGINPINNSHWAQYGLQAETLTAKIVGQISQIKINKNYRGLYYQPGNPVILYNGLANVPNPVGAIAEVGSVTSGSIQAINVINGGYGYTTFPNTIIDITNAPGAIATVSTIDPNPANKANATYLPVDTITLSRFTRIGNTRYSFFANNSSANANTTLANSFLFTSLSTFSIGSVIVQNGGGGITIQPVTTARSTYHTEFDSTPVANLSNLGILAPIQILNGGVGYQNNDTITISGGTGVGAYASVSSVNSSGGIQSVNYIYNTASPTYPLGGLGYGGALPTLNVVSSNTQAVNASLYVPGILGTGAKFSVSTDRTGSITTINIDNYGEDYISTPNVSLLVQDILVTGLTPSQVPSAGDLIYQGANPNTGTYVATVNNSVLFTSFANTQQSVYSMRVFNYTSQPDTKKPLNNNNKNISFSISKISPNVTNYGDGTARASATFLNGLTIGEGQYLDVAGQPSGFDVLQSTKYNNYTYEITLEKEIAKYRDILLNLIHPSGTQVIGRYALKSNSNFNYFVSDGLLQGYPLYHYTNSTTSNVSMSASFANPSSNTLVFSNLSGSILGGFITNTSIIRFTTPDGQQYQSGVNYVYGFNDDYLTDTGSEDELTATGSEDYLGDVEGFVYLKDNYWLAFANVAYGKLTAGSNTINISSVWTDSYNIVNNGNYSNTMYPLIDIIRTGDTILANGQTQTVSSIDYVKNIIVLSGNLANTVNGNVSVSRTIATTNVQILGPIGTQYIPELITQDGRSLTDQIGNVLILG